MKIIRNESYYKAFPVITGEMVEWFKAAVLKTAEVQASGGSNPSLSANLSSNLLERCHLVPLRTFFLSKHIYIG